MNAERIKDEIRSLDSQTKEIVMLFLDLILRAEQSGKVLPKVPEEVG